jgi:hypothetical protein
MESLTREIADCVVDRFAASNLQDDIAGRVVDRMRVQITLDYHEARMQAMMVHNTLDDHEARMQAMITVEHADLQSEERVWWSA